MKNKLKTVLISLIFILLPYYPLLLAHDTMHSNQQEKIENKSVVDSCFFCKVAQEENHPFVLKKYNHCFVFEDQFPVSPGHLLIIPFNHTQHWFTASSEIQHEIITILDDLKDYLDNRYHPDGYNIGINCGVAAGQSVHHLHVHIIPRYNGDMENPKGGVRGVIPSKQKY